MVSTLAHASFKLFELDWHFVSSRASLKYSWEQEKVKESVNLTVGENKKDQELSKPLKCVVNQWDYQAEMTFV